MFYWIYELNASDPGVFRLFGSPVFRGIAALLTALIVCLLLYPWLIRQLQLKQIGQVVRDDGPESLQEARNTDHGRHASRLIGDCLFTAVVQPQQSIRMVDLGYHYFLRRHRLCR